jgi:hypothetical protein
MSGLIGKFRAVTGHEKPKGEWRYRCTFYLTLNPLPLLFKSLQPGQEDCVFFSGNLNLHAKPETGIPYRKKNYNN